MDLVELAPKTGSLLYYRRCNRFLVTLAFFFLFQTVNQRCFWFVTNDGYVNNLDSCCFLIVNGTDDLSFSSAGCH